MNLALRILGVAILISAVAGATFGAFQVYDREAGFSSVTLTAPGSTPVTMLAGGSAQVSIGIENVGDSAANVTLESATDGFTFSTRRPVIPVGAGETTRASGTLGVEKGFTGRENVTVQAFSNDNDRRLGQVSFKVNVLEGSLGELTLESNLPAVVPGGNLSLQGELVNPVGTAQQVNFTATGLDATVEPASTQLQPNGTATVAVTATVPPDAADTVGIALTAENEAGDTVETSVQVPVVAEGDIAIAPTVDEVAVEPGNRYAVPILVVSNLAASADVSASGTNVVATDFTQVGPGEATGGFATLEIPEDASGELSATITVSVGDRSRDVTVAVDPSPDGDEATIGKQAKVNYVGRLVDGTVFDSSLPEIAHGPFAKSPSFRLRPGLEPISLTLNPRSRGTIPGFFDAVVNMTEGESRTVKLSPKEAYGPPRTHQNMSATSELDREQAIQRSSPQLKGLQPQQLPDSFDIENASEGDILEFTAPTTGAVFKFELVRKGEDTVDLRRFAEEGETTTFYEPWPNATEVTTVNETHIVYQTTPPDGIGNFTSPDVDRAKHEEKWENATTVRNINATTIELLHQPEVGLEYQASSSPRAPPQTFRVDGASETNVHVSTENQHPLAGKSLIFDITMVGISDPPQRGPISIGGGR